jgi:hypothetical protein
VCVFFLFAALAAWIAYLDVYVDCAVFWPLGPSSMKLIRLSLT